MDKPDVPNNDKTITDTPLIPDVYEIASVFAEFIAQADKQAETDNNSEKNNIL